MKQGKESLMNLLLEMLREQKIATRKQLKDSNILSDVVAKVFYSAKDQGKSSQKREKALRALLSLPTSYPYARVYEVLGSEDGKFPRPQMAAYKSVMVKEEEKSIAKQAIETRDFPKSAISQDSTVKKAKPYIDQDVKLELGKRTSGWEGAISAKRECKDLLPLGILNEGQSCYNIASLQMILTCNELCNELERVRNTRVSALCASIAEIIKAARNRDQEALDDCASSFRVMVGRITGVAEYKDRKLQHDCFEYINHLINEIHNEIEDSDINKGTLRCFSAMQTEFQWARVFNRVCSRCAVQNQQESAYALTLYMNGPSPSVQQMVDKEFGRSVEACPLVYPKDNNIVDKKKVSQPCDGTMSSSSQFGSLPRHLLVQISRYDAKGQKLQNPIGLCPLIDLSRHLAPGCLRPHSTYYQEHKVNLAEDEEADLKTAIKASLEMSHEVRTSTSKARYELKGILCHNGNTPSSGHYLFFGKREGSWFEFNDRSVDMIEWSEVQTKAEREAYGLLYKYVA